VYENRRTVVIRVVCSMHRKIKTTKTNMTLHSPPEKSIFEIWKWAEECIT